METNSVKSKLTMNRCEINNHETEHIEEESADEQKQEEFSTIFEVMAPQNETKDRNVDRHWTK